LKCRSPWITGIVSGLGILVLIIDGRTATTAVADGIGLCIQVVIPALFPFMCLGLLMNHALFGKRIAFLQLLNHYCGIPNGAETIMLTGLLGGYPIGAQSTANAWSMGLLNKKTAQRMLSFCNNAGPAFIFGLAGGIFHSLREVVALWVVLILSSVLTAIILPGKEHCATTLPNNQQITVTQAIEQSVRTMGYICAWVVLFRMLIAFLDRWFLWILPLNLRVFLYGIIELSNGCVALAKISSNALRFLICSCFLSFGGICVCMQTRSVIKELSVNQYIVGKLLQGLVSSTLCCIFIPFLYPGDQIPHQIITLIVIFWFIALTIIAFVRKNSSNLAESGV